MTPTQVQEQLSKLKDFQRKTVEYVFQRFYRDKPGVRRFLVADEVGLGKTLVARGLIAKCIRELEEQGVRRIDIIYVCSNAAIAQQNIDRLNVLGQPSVAYATRLTLLPQQIGDLEQNRVNFISFTPGTTFDLKSRGGTREERGLLYRLLVGKAPGTATALRNLLQAGAGPDNWDQHLQFIKAQGPDISVQLAETYLERLNNDPVHELLNEGLQKFQRRRDKPPKPDSELQYRIIGNLRQLLAKVCVEALEPDLIILDEFQRFKDLLHGESDAADLARSLFDFQGARVLLLSATPYRMLTLSHETDENHHKDFLDTVQFLQQGTPGDTQALQRNLSDFRAALLSTGSDSAGRCDAIRTAIETQLRTVMTRTERVSSTVRRDAMLGERQFTEAPTRPEVDEAIALEKLSKSLEVPDSIEYWKSSPSILTFMDNQYVLKKNLVPQGRVSEDTQSALEVVNRYCVKQRSVRRYEPLAMHNARLRTLARETLDSGNWQLLWLPPALPYIAPTGPYATLGPSAYTKALLFSSWAMVPKAVAALLSYEAERRMLGDTTGLDYDTPTQRPLLRFHVERGRGPGGMPTLALMYPCATLVAHVDPLALALDLGDGQPANLQDVRAHVARRIRPLVAELVARHGGTDAAHADERWYWAAPALLDQRHHRDVIEWLAAPKGFRSCFQKAESDDLEDEADETEESRTAFDRHVDELLNFVNGSKKLGPPPEDLEQVIADFALASPAVCAARAIMRVSRLASAWDASLLTAAARVAKGFRTLFNTPEAICMLRGLARDDDAYWRRVLEYCVEGNLQATLDEYAHLLIESTGKLDAAPDKIATAISETMADALSPRSANVKADELHVKSGILDVRTFNFHCRYALRFGDIRDEQESTVARAETVRHAFNSPFRPFVLASTSVGQEGLDFHSYCHVVYHWNLPSNPVDLEQREGRVHRYKGHAVRRNVARRFGLTALRQNWGGDGDPWERLFALAAAERPEGASELVPFWIFETEGGVQVERRVPLLSLSREIAQLDRLKRELALYRLAFGQPRQQDLLAYLVGRSDISAEEADRWRIRLEP